MCSTGWFNLNCFRSQCWPNVGGPWKWSPRPPGAQSWRGWLGSSAWWNSPHKSHTWVAKDFKDKRYLICLRPTYLCILILTLYFNLLYISFLCFWWLHHNWLPVFPDTIFQSHLGSVPSLVWQIQLAPKKEICCKENIRSAWQIYYIFWCVHLECHKSYKTKNYYFLHVSFNVVTWLLSFLFFPKCLFCFCTGN